MPEQEKFIQGSALTLSYLQKLSTKELTELFSSISNQFTLRLEDCKNLQDLKSLQTYLHLISNEIKLRDVPQRNGW
jgi:hypothetical protein